ncbi:MAG: T9SS type A sorting domain-containing protein, partial [Bacteroidota bacterium]|nr:T9SS type A sorting domain-containing protein [Bacteroidota bacterium]
AINQGNPFPRNVAILGDTIVISVLVYGIMWDRTIFSTDGGLTWTIGAGSIYSASTMVALTRNWTHEFHHIYINGYSFEMIHQRSSDFGMTWQDSSIISTLDNWSGMEPDPLGTVDNDLFIIWRDAKYGCMGFGCSGIIRQSTDEGVSWLPETVVTDTPWTLSHSLAIRKPIITAGWFTDDPNINVETNISYDYGKTWCPVFKVTPNESYTIFSSIVLTNRTVVLAWTSRDSLGAPFQIWCRTGILPETSVQDEPEFLPTDYKVLHAYPNPFNSSATIKYSLPKSSDVKLSIYNILGEKVAVLANEFQNAGWQEVVWESGNNPSGVYVYRLTAGKYTSAGKLLLIK